MNYPDPQFIIDALDETHISSRGAHLFEVFNLKEKDLRPDPMSQQGRRIYEDKTRGFQLEYEDEGRRKKIVDHEIGKGPWVLDQFFLRSGISGGNPYPGVLPYGIKFEMNRTELGALLGPPVSSNQRVEIWSRAPIRLLLNYEPKSGAIKSVGMQLLESKI
ncbi:hypothetical protein [Phyllobacterium sp. YR531]|uniref:hypothetical protein n=1 Tax=Phyllobacterium sp. YR531 TaxID=1144343 RepID=UPI00026F6CFA|nr:hypothetical protein [Phyllobacterium sp. YR531]EJN01623.1 hypothetical protein PMI41_03336 [Phyllobacterium sp. YR531]